MIHHYLQRGFTDEFLLNLAPSQRMFYMASMQLYHEEEAERYKELSGGG